MASKAKIRESNKKGIFVRRVWRPLNLYGPTIHDAQFDLDSTWRKDLFALGWSGRNARSDIINGTDGGSSISTQVRVGLFQGSGFVRLESNKTEQGSADRNDPFTMWTHHFTIFNIDCTKLTLKESDQDDADGVDLDDLRTDVSQIIFQCLHKKKLVKKLIIIIMFIQYYILNIV